MKPSNSHSVPYRVKSLLLASLLLISALSQAEHLSLYGYNYSRVFANEANLREAPSRDAKILGKLKPGQPIYLCIQGEALKTSVPGWQAVTYQGRTAYIHTDLLADAYCKSQLNPDIAFLFQINARHEAGFKIFRNDTLIGTAVLKRKKHLAFEGLCSLGTTYNSAGNEVLACRNGEINSYELYEWNGKTITTSSLTLNDASLITRIYHQYDTGFVNTDLVHLRAAPASSAAIVATLHQNTRLRVLQTDTAGETLNNEWGSWHKVMWKGREAYIFSRFMDVPVAYIKSNKNPHEAFLLTNWGLYALRHGSVVCRQPISYVWSGSDNRLHDFGTRGLKGNFQLLGICMLANSCGEYGGDLMYLWDGSRFKYLTSDGGIGDGGLSDSFSAIFPSDEGGKKDRVICHAVSSEYDDSVNGACVCGNYAVKSESITECELKGDTLVEVPTVHTRVRAFVAQNYKHYSVQHYTSTDLNSDGFTDIIYLLNDSLNDYDSKVKPLVGVAFGNSTGGFEHPLSNSAIVLKKYFAVEFKANDNRFGLTVKYKLGYDKYESDIPELEEFEFVFDQQKGQLNWHSILTASGNAGNDRNFEWAYNNKQYFKSKKIPFEKAWNPKEVRQD